LTVPRAAFLFFLFCLFFLVVGGGLYTARAQESPRAPPPREVPFLGGAFTTGQAAQRAPPKTTGLPLAGPDQARSLRLSPSRESFFRRNPEQLGSEHGPGEHADWGGGGGAATAAAASGFLPSWRISSSRQASKKHSTLHFVRLHRALWRQVSRPFQDHPVYPKPVF
jgi:hypothetical protein